jgi:hypothetical protein
MNYKMILASALLTVACSSVVFATEQSTEICQNPSNEKMRALCEKIEQLQSRENENKSMFKKVKNDDWMTPGQAELLREVTSPLILVPVVGIGYAAYKYHVLGYLLAAGVPVALLMWFVIAPLTDIVLLFGEGATELGKAFFKRY